jgi:hypothetical protein
VDREAGAESFVEQVGTLNADGFCAAAGGRSQGAAKFFQTSVLLTLYNADRHLTETYLERF